MMPAGLFGLYMTYPAWRRA